MPMRITIVPFALLTIAACGTADVQTNAIRIIANPNVNASEISRDDPDRIFLMTKTSLPGAPHVEPVLEKAGPVCELFLKDYMGRTNAALMTYYRSLMFSGKASVPKSFNSDSEVTAYVAKTKGAVGYVGFSANVAAVKTLKVTE